VNFYEEKKTKKISSEKQKQPAQLK